MGNIIGPLSCITKLINRKTGKSTPLKNISFAARRIALRRGDDGETVTSRAIVGGSAPPASHSANPLSASPQREQYLISSETCCWPQLGQYIRRYSTRSTGPFQNRSIFSAVVSVRVFIRSTYNLPFKWSSSC